MRSPVVTSTPDVYIVRRPGHEDAEFPASRSSAQEYFDLLASADFRVEVQLLVRHRWDGDEEHTDLLRSRSGVTVALDLDLVTLRVIQVALRNLRIDLDEADDFQPWLDTDAQDDVDPLASELGMSDALGQAQAKIAAALVR